VTREPLTHNPANGVTAGVWREDGVVHKVLTRRRDAPAHWAASDDPRHWNSWRREALVYTTGLPARLGLGAPRLLGCEETPEGDIELRLEAVEGRHGADLTVDDLAALARALGRAQAGRQPREPWLSAGFLRAYSTTRPADMRLLDDDAAWDQSLVRAHFPPASRDALRAFHLRRDRLLALMEALPRTVCHLDVWPNNVIRRPDGEIVLLDWAFTGDGALGEDIGNLIPDAVLDLLLPHTLLGTLDARLTAAYLRGLRDGGFAGDERVVRLGICASGVKYDWLTAHCLEHAAADAHADYGGGPPVDPNARYAARAAGLALVARWADEALSLAAEIGIAQGT
jgi:hypothetical protein